MDPEPITFFATFLWSESVSVLIQLLLVLFLLLLSALISGAEVAFFSLSPKLWKDSFRKTTIASHIERLLDRPKRLLATILIANNFINIAIVLLFASLRQYYMMGIENETLQLVIDVGIITAIILIFGEILPKIYANRNALKFAQLMAYPISLLDTYFLFWLTIPMSKTTRFLELRLAQKPQGISVDNLSKALELTANHETTQEEQKILEGIVNFGSTDTKQVMCPRIDVFALAETTTFKEVLSLITENGYSRIPVYKDNLDEITGILYVKDLLPHLEKKKFAWKKLLKAPYYVPENKKLDDLLHDFQRKKMHMAIVVDEYGGTSGLITLEDILEEIVGEISDEFDEDALRYSRIDDATYVFEGKINLKDFIKVIEWPVEDIFDAVKGEAETLAGLLLEVAKRLPRKGQKIEHKGFNFTIEEVDRKRIVQVKVRVPKSIKAN